MFNREIYILIIITALIIALAVLYNIYKLFKKDESLREIERLQKIAFTDDLTQIPNRAAYSNHIEGLQVGGVKGKTAVILFDVDGFKYINDNYGHLNGDCILRSVAKMLTEIFSSKNFSVYRIGGDEFAVIAENTTEEKVINLLLQLQKREIKCGDFYLSKGYSMISEKESFKDAFYKADEMLYADKNSRK